MVPGSGRYGHIDSQSSGSITVQKGECLIGGAKGNNSSTIMGRGGLARVRMVLYGLLTYKCTLEHSENQLYLLSANEQTALPARSRRLDNND